mgnify:CR=1 FL=1
MGATGREFVFKFLHVLKEYGIDLELRELEKEDKERYYGTIEKYYFSGDKQTEYKGIISINFKRVKTNNKLRLVIAHELAHLVSSEKSFRERWKFWNKRCKELVKIMENENVK